MSAGAANDELGGAPQLPLLLAGSGTIAGRFADRGDGGLAAAVSEATDGAVEVIVTPAPGPPDQAVWEQVDSLAELAVSHPLTVLVFDGDLPDRWPADLDQVRAAIESAVVRLKEAGTRIIAVGASTMAPLTEQGHAASKVAHELDLVLLETSVSQGISILDVDRIVAELGGDEHVGGFLDYDLVVQKCLVDELVRIIEEYGFFEARPLVPQRGARRR